MQSFQTVCLYWGDSVIWYFTSGELLMCLTNLKPTTVPVTCLYLFYTRPGSVNVTYTITSTSEITEEEVQEFIDKNLLYNCKITDTSVEYQLVLTCESESNSFVRSRESRKVTHLHQPNGDDCKKESRR